jgi:hypothetical protein
MYIKISFWGRAGIGIAIVAGLGGMFLIHLASEEYIIPNCVRFHSGQVFVDVPYPPDALTYVPDSPTQSVQLRFYRTALIKAHIREPFFVLRIGEDSARFEPVDMFINSPDPGPKYTEKVSFNGHDAAFAPGKRMFYEIPYANRVIAMEYSTEDLTPEEVPVVEAMMKKITITTADSDYKGEGTVEECTARKGLSGIF